MPSIVLRPETRRDGKHLAPIESLTAAEDALADRRMFRLDERRWKAFQIILDRPVVNKPRLARLLSEKSALE